MEYLIISSRGRFGAENRESAEILARMLSAFETDAVQVLKHGTHIAAYFEQRECKRLEDCFFWEHTVAGQHMTNEFKFIYP